ncbi:MAG: sulfurtransferase TusA family protein [Deltaproteobacteria bacterium]|nr:sulfurtransferase TusA family protein [Deltaproteobacteria bacterium]
MVATQVDDAAETWTGENLSDLANANLANSDQTSSNLANSNQTSFHQANSDRASINLTSVDNNSSLISASLDITDVVCPMTLVKTQVTLADLPEGAILAIRLNEGEPAENLPRSLKDAGHQVLKTRDNGDGSLQLLVQKGARG